MFAVDANNIKIRAGLVPSELFAIDAINVDKFRACIVTQNCLPLMPIMLINPELFAVDTNNVDKIRGGLVPSELFAELFAIDVNNVDKTTVWKKLGHSYMGQGTSQDMLYLTDKVSIQVRISGN